jgi:UDP-3-O-[3-hydroxymyristoyl] N-acetylglucosamine deacetylase
LLDGAAARWTAAVEALEIPLTLPSTKIARAATIVVGSSRYELLPGPSPSLEVSFEVDDPRLARSAAWGGDVDDFRARIAPARTFAFARDIEELLASSLARHVDPSSVVVIAPGAVHCAGRPFEADEPARHKLLDLMGDLYLHGGPPLGVVRATRPGHAANLEAFRRAVASGVVAPR